ncbi:MAG: hypothetical protein AAGM22_05865 [Acidobacteriota bacterium]
MRGARRPGGGRIEASVESSVATLLDRVRWDYDAADDRLDG